MRIHTKLCVTAVLALVLGASSANAAPQGPWVKPAKDLTAAGLSADAPQLTTAPDGTTTAVWRRSNGVYLLIQAATRPPGGSFGAPVDLSATGQNALSPQVTTAPDGTTTAVWFRSDGSNYIIQTATRPPGGAFGAPVDLSATGQNAGSPQIATAPDGTTTVVWNRFNGANNIIQAATRPPGSSFGTPVDLSAIGKSADGSQIATAPDGTTTVVWRRYNGSHFIIQAVTRPPGGSFGAPVDLSTPGQSANAPQIATAPDGTTTVVWQRYDGTDTLIQAATRPPGGAFGAPVDLSAPGQSALGAQITTAPDGTATVVWQRPDGSNNIIQSATRPPGGSFGPPVDLSAAGQSAFEPQVSSAPDGTKTAVWYRSNGSNYIVQSATRPPGGSFGAPEDLSAIGRNSVSPQIATAPDGSATAVWFSSGGSNTVIQAISTARPSILLGVAKSGKGGGTVNSAPAGIDCGSECAENYPSFTKVTLTAKPESGSTFEGWGGACEEAMGNSCELTLLDDVAVTAGFGKPRLRVTRVKPKKPKVRRGRKVKVKVTGKNSGDAARNARLCVKLGKKLKKKLKPKGKTCRKLGSLGPGKAKTKPFKLKATGKAKRGKKYRVRFRLSAANAKTTKRAVKVKVK